MNLSQFDGALFFDSVQDRNLAIDALIRSNLLTETDSIAMQKINDSTKLVGSFSDAVFNFLKDYWPPKPAPVTTGEPTDFRKDVFHLTHLAASESLRQTNPSDWLEYWSDTLDEIKADSAKYLAGGADLEAVNRRLWVKLRGLVTQAGYESFRMRARRYRVSNTGKPLNIVQRFLWWVRGKRLEWQLIKKKVLYGAFDRYDTDPAHDPAKVLAIKCGYCGSEWPDDAVRPKLQEMLPIQQFTLQKALPIQMQVYNTVMKYETPRTCNDCHEALQYAFICKVARAVTAVLL